MAGKLPFLHPNRTPSPVFEFQRSHFPYSRQNLLPNSTTTTIKSVPGDQSSSSLSLSQNVTNLFLSPPLPKTSDFSRPFIVKSQLNFPLISPHDKWGTWTALFATGAFGIWLERTEIRSSFSGATVSILVGIAASNLGIIPYESPAYSIVLEFLLPLAVSSLLIRAASRPLRQSTWKLLLAFLLGSVATIVGTVLAYLMVPMRSLGRDSWKIAAALMAANYVATADRLGLSRSALAAGLAADNVIYALQFAILFALASKIPPESSTSTNDVSVDKESNAGDKRLVLRFATAVAVAFAMCKAGTHLMKYFGIQGGSLRAVTAIAVILATALPTQFSKLAPNGEAIALVLIQVFYAVVGARANIWSATKTAPSIFLFALVQLTIRLALILGLGKLFRFDRKLLLLASNVGDSTAACGMATAKGWSSLIVPAILAGFFGNGIGIFLGLFFGDLVLDFVYFMRVMRNIIDLICTIFRID